VGDGMKKNSAQGAGKKLDGGVSERYKSRKKALTWLQDNGYKISTGKFYQDCKAGFPSVGSDGTVSKYQVILYGQQLVSGVVADVPISTREDDHRKNRADADIAEMKAEKMRREEDKDWLHAEDAWSAMAGLIGTLRDCIRHHIYVKQGEIVLSAAGKQDRSQEVFGFVDEVISQAFNEVAGSAISVQFEKGVE